MAIKTSELRIGNYLYADFAPVKVVEIDEYTFRAEEDEVFPDADECEPIPLTEDWLRRFGFEMRMINGHLPEWYIMCTPPHYKREFALVFRFGMKKSSPKGVCDEQRWHAWMDSGDSHSFNIQSIHQLQNLYHALTGEELQIKEA